jgi:hypothetical protein
MIVLHGSSMTGAHVLPLDKISVWDFAMKRLKTRATLKESKSI